MPLSRLRTILAAEAGLTVLLVSLLIVLFVIYPFVPLAGPGRFVVSAALTLVLVAGSFSLADRRRLLAAALALAAVALLTRWARFAVDDEGLQIVSHTATILFLALTGGGVLAKVLRPGRITSHRIQGAIAFYLMLGLVWAFAYSLVELRAPGSFDLTPAGDPGESRMRTFTYFSFVTLTTLGYGDVTPKSSPAQTLAILEALTGQLYLVILVARLVALQIADARDA